MKTFNGNKQDNRMFDDNYCDAGVMAILLG